MTKYNSIGKIVATHGLLGELVLLHQLGKKSSLKGLAAIFLEMHRDEMLPYFIESTKIKSETEVLLKLEGVASKEAARRFTQKEVWLTEEDFTRFAAKTSSLSLLGFHLINEGVDLGEILEVIEQPHQVLCTIDLEGKEALIPLHEETLHRIDRKGKQVYVSLPEGLLDIFR